MKYLSTRDASLRKNAAEVIAQGLSRDGGLFTPEQFPVMPEGFLEKLMPMTYQQRAVEVMSLYLDDFTKEELADYADKAYRLGEKFDTADVAPVYHLTEGTEVLELWHGPTCAFKDMALQMLPHLLDGVSPAKNGDNTHGLHPGGHLRRYRQGGTGGLPRCGSDPHPGVLSRGRR